VFIVSQLGDFRKFSQVVTMGMDSLLSPVRLPISPPGQALYTIEDTTAYYLPARLQQALDFLQEKF
jgi:hypothetical protein